MGPLRRLGFEADCAGLGALGLDPVPGGFLGVFRHESFQVGLRRLMLPVGLSGSQIGGRQLCPLVRGGHVDHSDSLQSWARRLDVEQSGRLATLDTAPEQHGGVGEPSEQVGEQGGWA